MGTPISVFVFLVFFSFSRAAPAAYGDSQARGQIRAIAADPRHSHSNSGFELHLRSTPQLTATLDPRPTEQGQGSNPQPPGSSSDSLTTAPRRELHTICILNPSLSLAALWASPLPLGDSSSVPALAPLLQLCSHVFCAPSPSSCRICIRHELPRTRVGCRL